jgi:hypothetical protein
MAATLAIVGLRLSPQTLMEMIGVGCDRREKGRWSEAQAREKRPQRSAGRDFVFRLKSRSS